MVPWRLWVAAHHLPATSSLRASLSGSGWHDTSRGQISLLVVLGQMFSPRGWLLLAPLGLAAVATLARAALPARHRLLVVGALATLGGIGLLIAFLISGPSFPFPWRARDWILFIAALGAAATFVWVVVRARGLAAWSVATTALMVGTFVVAYVVSTYPFAWILGTSSARVVIGPELF